MKREKWKDITLQEKYRKITGKFIRHNIKSL